MENLRKFQFALTQENPCTLKRDQHAIATKYIPLARKRPSALPEKSAPRLSQKVRSNEPNQDQMKDFLNKNNISSLSNIYRLKHRSSCYQGVEKDALIVFLRNRHHGDWISYRAKMLMKLPCTGHNISL